MREDKKKDALIAAKVTADEQKEKKANEAAQRKAVIDGATKVLEAAARKEAEAQRKEAESQRKVMKRPAAVEEEEEDDEEEE